MALHFYSENGTSISLKVDNKIWDGTLQYSYDNSTWNTFTNGTTYSGTNIYLRGSGNTRISFNTSAGHWGITLTGTKIHCDGNIQELLDYANPTLTISADCCYASMFGGCTSLVSAPTLSATTLADGCYFGMFNGCTSLTTAPALPATTLAVDCYSDMFYGCTSLVSAPALPATTLANYCYSYMFYGCSKIKLSTTQDATYTTAYRIPVSGTGTTRTSSLTNMFTNTGGTFTGTPTINTTYYMAVPVSSTITSTLTNITASSSNPTTITDTATLTFTANSGYVLPQSISVVGATYTFDRYAGQVVLTAPTANVVITMVADVYKTYHKELLMRRKL